MFNSIKEAFLKFITSRMTIIAFFLFFCAGTLIFRLFDLQIVHGEDYLNSFQLRIKKEKEISGTRGNIYDRNGNLLAYNELANSVTIEDVYDAGSGRNTEINKTVNKLIDMIESNGDQVVSDFNIALDENNDFEFTVENTAKMRFLADVYGRLSISDLKYEEKTKTAAEVVQDLAVKFGIGRYKSNLCL